MSSEEARHKRRPGTREYNGVLNEDFMKSLKQKRQLLEVVLRYTIHDITGKMSTPLVHLSTIH